MRSLLSAGLSVVVLLVALAAAVSAAPSAGDELDEVYVNRYTGEVSAVPNGVTFAVSEADGPVVFCASRYTGQLTWRYSQSCAPSSVSITVNVDWSGSVDACVNRYTAKLRYLAHGSCTPAEYPVTI